MAGKPSNEKERARALLSADARPKIEIPRSAQHERRKFKLPDQVKTPAPTLAAPVGTGPSDAAESATDATDEDRAPRRRRPSTARFRDRTLGWFKIGDDLATQDEMPRSDADDETESHSAVWLAVGGFAVAMVIVVAFWLL